MRDSRVAAERFVSWVRLAISSSMAVVVAFEGRESVPYPRAAWTILAVAIVYAWLAFLKTTRDARRGETNLWTAWALSALSGILVAATAAVTGAGRSPIIPVAITVVISTAIRFDLARSLAVAASLAASLSAAILWVPRPDVPWHERVRDAAWWSWLMIAVALLVGVLSRAADLARQARAEAEAEAEAEHRRRDEEHRLRLHVESVDSARRDFLHALAHDFRTPISSIEALSTALARRSADLDPKERADLAGLIERHARHLSAMLGEVREVAVRESLGADRRVELADVYVPDLVRSAGAAAGLEADRLVSTIDDGLTLLRTDGEKALRILTNLLENANKHSPAAAPVEVHVALGDGAVELVVLDRGPGMPAEFAPRAFEKSAAYGPHRSTGLGMWIVAQLVDSLRGSVWIEVRDGGGLVVRARFPLGPTMSVPTA
ncbi:MAG TPA: HAMP domain-containing sensor histidine kinase [Acidimicrobiia bacterium]|nr:HAMP domain-containing sensor histidine kinase [Acidimicrobiia bacterium]